MGLKRSVRLGIILCALSLSAAAQMCQYGSSYNLPFIGVEDPTVLYQFAYPCNSWLMTASGTTPWTNARPIYNSEDNSFAFAVEDSLGKSAYGGTCPASGTEVVVACNYAEGSGTVNQRAWYAAGVIALTESIPTGDGVAFVEVPPATAVNVAGTVTITWAAVPANTAVAGYRVQRSADGITDWATVGDTTDLTINDTPGAGTWYYSVVIRYAGSPTTYVSEHGLVASVVVE